MASRRGNGEGGIYHLKDGTWEARIMIGRDVKGKPTFKTFTSKKRSVVAAKLANYIANQKGIEPRSNGNMTVAKWLLKWFDDYVDKNVKISTKSSYETIIQRHLIPYIGHIKLDKLKKADIEEMYLTLLKKGRADGKGGLSVKTVNNVALVLHKALSEAMKHELIIKNPADIADVPTLRSTNTKKKEVEVLTRQEQEALINACGDDVYSVAIKVDLLTGMRLGELLGLQWKDINHQNRTLTICRQVNRLKDYSPNAKAKTRLGIQDDTKTKNSNRTIPIPEGLIKLFDRYKIQQDEQKRRFGKGYHHLGMIFSREDGYYIDPATFRDHYQQKLNESGVKHHTFHALRHTFATRALEAGIPVKVVSQLLGHASVQITMDTYMHVLPELQSEAMDKIAAYMGISEKEKEE